MSVRASILVCTRNRAASLAATLVALRASAAAAPVLCEVVVVDNGSTDGTAAVLAAAGDGVRALSEPTPGKSRALNRALAAARGDVLLFTDDDVRPPADWVGRMAGPIWSDEADAVAGGIRLADHLRRPWIGPAQRKWLASTEDLPPDEPHPLIGANMAVARRVFDRVPGFDPEVGPGGLGHAEDTLFWLQVREAGFRIATRFDVEVEHHLEPDRLGWPAFAKQARKRGEFAAYVEHHWEWYERPRPRTAFAHAAALLALGRLRRLPSWLTARTMPEWELPLVDRYHARRCLLRERRRPRNYARHGLRGTDSTAVGG